MAQYISNEAPRIYSPKPIRHGVLIDFDQLFTTICSQSEDVARETILSFISDHSNSQMLSQNLSEWLNRDKSKFFENFTMEQKLHYLPRMKLVKSIVMSKEFAVTVLHKDQEYLQDQIKASAPSLDRIESLKPAMEILQRSLEGSALSPKQKICFIFSALGKSWGEVKFHAVIKNSLTLSEMPQDTFYLLFKLAGIEKSPKGFYERLQAPLRHAEKELPDEVWRSELVKELLKKCLLNWIRNPLSQTENLNSALKTEQFMIKKIVECHADLAGLAKEYAFKRFADAFVDRRTSQEDLDLAFSTLRSLQTTELRHEYAVNMVKILFRSKYVFNNPERTARYFPEALRGVERKSIIHEIVRAKLNNGIHCYFSCFPIEEQTEDHFKELLFQHAVISFVEGNLHPMRALVRDPRFEIWDFQAQVEDLKFLCMSSKTQFLDWKLSLAVFEKMGPNAFQDLNSKKLAVSIIANGLSCNEKKVLDLKGQEMLNFRDWITFTGVILGTVEPFKYPNKPNSKKTWQILDLMLDKVAFFPDSKIELYQLRLSLECRNFDLKLQPFFDHIVQIFRCNQLSVNNMDVVIKNLETAVETQAEKIPQIIISHYLKSQMVVQYKKVLREKMESIASLLDPVRILQ